MACRVFHPQERRYLTQEALGAVADYLSLQRESDPVLEEALTSAILLGNSRNRPVDEEDFRMLFHLAAAAPEKIDYRDAVAAMRHVPYAPWLV
jgi:hypothetical protein